MKKNFIYVLSAVAVLAFSLTSCKKEEAKEYAKIMVTHASPDAPGVDLLVDGTVQNSTALTFPNSTAYLQVEAGTRNIKVNGAGSTSSVIDANIDFAKDGNYSIFAVDSFSKISAVVLEDDLTAPASGKAHVRFVHLSPDAPAVDVAVQGTNDVVFDNVSFKGSTAFTPLNAGNYNLDVRLDQNSTVVLTLPTITLEAGKIYTVFARGFAGATAGTTQALNAQIIVNK
jgi:hypothetical protein